MVNEENTENLVALQLNLARGIAEIKLLVTEPSQPIQLYQNNALLFDSNRGINFLISWLTLPSHDQAKDGQFECTNDIANQVDMAEFLLVSGRSFVSGPN